MSSPEPRLDPRTVAAIRRLARLVAAEERELALDLIANLHSIEQLRFGGEPMIYRLQAFQAALRHAVADNRAADPG